MTKGYLVTQERPNPVSCDTIAKHWISIWSNTKVSFVSRSDWNWFTFARTDEVELIIFDNGRKLKVWNRASMAGASAKVRT